MERLTLKSDYSLKCTLISQSLSVGTFSDHFPRDRVSVTNLGIKVLLKTMTELTIPYPSRVSN